MTQRLPLPLILATQNADKAHEIVAIFVEAVGEPLAAYCIDGAGYLLSEPDSLAAAIDALPELTHAPDVEETGATLEENARIKAQGVADALGLLAVSDDTGLAVDALNGAPGVYSARYAGPHATYVENVMKLLDELEGVDKAQRTARFTTVAIARTPAGGETVAAGVVEGTIADAPRGESGFGYDPVFVPNEGDGRSFAEMAAGEKHAVSHRGRAFRGLARMLTGQEDS
jgi:XTP/dITP diphosphohydrolase